MAMSVTLWSQIFCQDAGLLCSLVWLDFFVELSSLFFFFCSFICGCLHYDTASQRHLVRHGNNFQRSRVILHKAPSGVWLPRRRIYSRLLVETSPRLPLKRCQQSSFQNLHGCAARSRKKDSAYKYYGKSISSALELIFKYGFLVLSMVQSVIRRTTLT